MDAEKMGRGGIGIGVLAGGAVGWWLCAGEGLADGSVSGPVCALVGAVVGGLIGGLTGWVVGKRLDSADR